ncbi:MAG: MFS transporter, partial [Gemmatimonadetes bacterium]|nr:MFS transporter [Gemmatimonadota bacterium]NIX47237.1 MFS transporter [Gemmatimonadota bacterium]
MAARISDGKGSGVRYSIFSFGGAAGYALGPLAAVGVVALVGLGGLWVAMIPGVLLALGLAAVLPPDRGSSHP